MSQEIEAALTRAMSALFNDVQGAIVQSRMTRWRDMFLVGRVVREEVSRYAKYGTLIDPFTLRSAIPRENFIMLVERCLERIGEERGLDYEVVEAAIKRATGATS